MKPLILLTSSIFLLSSCGMTQEAAINKTKDCDALGRYADMDGFGNISCGARKLDKVQQCINSYIDAITTSDPREDNYSNVVKTCNETFGTRNPIE